jgi:hypothetical protein
MIIINCTSNYAKSGRQDDSKFDLLRQVVLLLRSEDYSIESFGYLVRIGQILTRLLLLTDTTRTAVIRGGEIS